MKLARDEAAPRETDVATWLPIDVGYTDTMSVKGMAFSRPSIRQAPTGIALTAFQHPAAVARMALAGLGPKQIASALLWRETGRYFGIKRLVDLHGQDVAETHVLGRPRRSPAARAKSPVSFTGVLIAQNEEDVIADALTSLTPFVDELIVLDGGSSDATIEIARSCGATVHHRQFDNDFAAQRNALLDLVRTPWVISLDCDERLTPELGALTTAIASETDVDAVVTPHLSLVGDHPLPSHWPDYHVRVHRSALRYRRPVHEYLRYRSAIFTPLNGPFIQHHKTPIRFARGAIRYSEIDPTLAKPEDVAKWRAWVQELEEEQREG